MTLDNNLTGSISAFPYAQIDMLSPDASRVIAVTSPLDETGSTFTVTANVPEPSTLALLACSGLVGLVVYVRRHRRS